MKPDAGAAALVELLADCRDDPGLFNEAILCRPPYWTSPVEPGRDQAGWVKACTESPVVVVESANAMGKDYALGGLLAWWLFTRPDSLVVLTGPSQTLLGTVTWKEVRRAMDPKRSPVLAAFPEVFGVDVSDGTRASPLTLKLDKAGWGALAFSTDTIERASGQHAADLAVFVTEASAIDPRIGAALDGLNPRLLVVCSNPIRATGWAVDLAERGRADERAGVPFDRAVRYFNLPARLSPDIGLRRSPRGLADGGWLDLNRRKHGEDSSWWRSHVLALRPTADFDALISPQAILRAFSAEAAARAALARREGTAGPRRLACDVGEGMGKSATAVLVRDDVGVLALWSDRSAGPTEAAEAMLRHMEEWDVPPDRTTYDAGGTTGSRLRLAMEAIGLFGCSPHYGGVPLKRRYHNLRTAAAAALARALDPDPGPDGPRPPFHLGDVGALRDDLTAELGALRGRTDLDRYRLESKADMQARLGRSPDLADVFVQSFREEALS